MGRYFVADAAEKAMPAVVNINISLRIPGAGWIPAVAQQMVRHSRHGLDLTEWKGRIKE